MVTGSSYKIQRRDCCCCCYLGENIIVAERKGNEMSTKTGYFNLDASFLFGHDYLLPDLKSILHTYTWRLVLCCLTKLLVKCMFSIEI